MLDKVVVVGVEVLVDISFVEVSADLENFVMFPSPTSESGVAVEVDDSP